MQRYLITAIIIAVLCAGLATLAFYVPALSWIILIALVPLLVALWNTPLKPLNAVIMTWLVATFIHACINAPLVPTIIALRDMPRFSLPVAVLVSIGAWLGLAIYQGAFTAPIGIISVVVRRRWGILLAVIAVACAWTLSEYVRSLGIMGYLWGCLAYALLPQLPLLQIAEWTGTYGLVFAIVLVNGLVAAGISYCMQGKCNDTARMRAWAMLIIAGLSVATWYVTGLALMVKWEDELNSAKLWHVIRVGIVQGNVPRWQKRSVHMVTRLLNLHLKLTHKALRSDVELIIWSESALPIPLNEWSYMMRQLQRTATGNDVDMLIGALESQRVENVTAGQTVYRYYNACYALNRTGQWMGTYRKIRLVPFGEFVPLRKRLPFMEFFAALPQDFTHGNSIKPLRVSSGRFGIAICFDSLFPWIARMEAHQGAGALIIITNDEWFWGSWMAKHHADIAILRAIENRRYLMRAANTGISRIIDPLGRVQKELQLSERGILIGTVALRKDASQTIYSRHGDWVIVCTALLLIGLIIGARLSSHRTQLERGT